MQSLLVNQVHYYTSTWAWCWDHYSQFTYKSKRRTQYFTFSSSFPGAEDYLMPSMHNTTGVLNHYGSLSETELYLNESKCQFHFLPPTVFLKISFLNGLCMLGCTVLYPTAWLTLTGEAVRDVGICQYLWSKHGICLSLPFLCEIKTVPSSEINSTLTPVTNSCCQGSPAAVQ